MRSIIPFWICLFWAMCCKAQDNSPISKILQSSFIPFSDSILIKNDSNRELATLYALANNKEIVAIGEVTHGTKEVLAFQNLIAINLVESYGFKCIVLGEVSMLDSYMVNDFVVNMKGRADELEIKGKVNIREVAYRQSDMIDFYVRIRDFNKNKPFRDRIWIIGADIDEPKEIIDFIKRHCQEQQIPNAIAVVDKLNAGLKKVYRSGKAGIHAIVESSDHLIQILESSRNKTDSANMKIDIMIRVLQTLPQLIAFSSGTDLKYKMRDKFIFENVEWLIKACKKDKIVIIKVHNFHSNRKTIYTEVFGKFLALGEYLSKHYQQKYLSIGTEVLQGRFYTGASTTTKIAQNKNKLGNMIGSNTNTQYGVLFCDSTAKEFLNKPQYTISYGTVNYKSSLLINGKGLIGDAFDALIFIRNSTPYKSGRD